MLLNSTAALASDFIVIYRDLYRDRPPWKHDGQEEESQIDLY